jgi:hypothetical protein
MSKENEDAPKELNILDTPFGDGLEMQFSDEYSDEFKENNSVAQPLMQEDEDMVPDNDNFKEPVKEVIKDLPKEEVKERVKAEPRQDVSSDEGSNLKVFASWLGEKGLVDYDEESFEDSEDGLKKLMSNTVEREVENYKNSLPDDVHKLVEFIEAGGNPKNFMDVYYGDASWSDFDIDDERSQKTVLKEYLKAQGEDDEDIDETIDTYEVSGILEKKAKGALNKLQAYEKNYKDQIFEQQKRQDADQRVLAKQQYDSFKSELYAKEEIQGFKLTPKMKDNLWDFMMKPDKTGETGLQKHNKTNTNAQYMYAYLAMNDWDLSKLERQVKTKVNSELASRLSNVKDGRSKMKSGQSDNFNDQRATGDFSAFKQALTRGMI